MEGNTKLWDIGGDGFDSLELEGAGLLEIATLSLDEPAMESVLFTDDGEGNEDVDWMIVDELSERLYVTFEFWLLTFEFAFTW